MGEGKRHEMMETLFGAESEDSDDDNEARERPAVPYSDDEVEGGGQIDVESEGERAGSELDRVESEEERVESEAEREDSDADHSYDEEEHVKQQRRPIAAERRGLRQHVSASGSEQSHEGGQPLEHEEDEVEQFHRGGNEEEEDEVEQVREHSDEGDDSKAADGVAEMRDVFGDSDEEEQEPDNTHHTPDAREEMSASDDERSVQRGIRPEDIVPDTEQHEERYESDEDQPGEHRVREKPVGPPLHIDVPLCPPSGPADKMHIVRVSNIMGIESKPFDPKTYTEEEEHFVTDESGHKQRLRLEDNVARWRRVRDRDGSVKYESNARFVKWSDGSMQLLIGNEVLDISIQKAHQDQGHLFLRHAKGILQSQGRLLQKMKFMPSSLSSKSHRLLTALVDSRNRKIYKVKNVITNKDPEREKEEAEKLHQKRIRSKEDLQRKQEKISRKYNPTRERVEQQLSPGFLEGALEEDEEVDEYQKQIEEDSRAERRIMNAKRQASASSREPIGKRMKNKYISPARRRDVEEKLVEESEHSEYESDGEEDDTRLEEDAHEAEVDEEEGDEVEEEDSANEQEKERGWDDGDDETYKKRKGREDDSENEPSPPRKPAQRRRVVVSDSE